MRFCYLCDGNTGTNSWVCGRCWRERYELANAIVSGNHNVRLIRRHKITTPVPKAFRWMRDIIVDIGL